VIDVVHVEVAAVAPAAMGVLGLLSQSERERATRYRSHCDRDEFVVGRVGLRLLLGARLRRPPAALELVTGPAGAPGLGGDVVAPVQFGLSHSGGRVVYALWTTGRVGIDIEAVTDVDAATADLILAPDERARLEAVAPPQRSALLLRWWTAKEAYLKALRVGLQRDPRSVAVATPDAGRAVEDVSLDGVRWRIRRIDLGARHEVALVTDDLAASVCVRPWTDAMMASLAELAGASGPVGRSGDER
jgi:4'-phosphopantetheinyl transferase